MKKFVVLFMAFCVLFSAVPGNVYSQADEETARFENPNQMQSRIYTLDYASAESVKDVVKKLLSPQGSISFDTRTNSVIVFDYPYILQSIDSVIPKLDIRAPDVMIEVRVIETSYEFLRSIGFDLSRINTGYIYYKGPVDFKKIADKRYVSARKAGVTEGLIPFSTRDIIFNALEKNTQTKLFTMQKVRVQSNTTGYIKLTQQTAIGQDKYTIGFNDVIVSRQDAERALTGRILKVTPRVNPEGIIDLRIQTEVITAQRSKYFADTLDPFARIAAAQLLVNDGDTVVLASEESETTQTTTQEVPMTNVPVGRRKHRERRILTIFVTATIL